MVGVTAEGVQFQTIYGEGTIVIPWSNIEMIQSDKDFEVLYGEAEIMEGRIWGLEDDALLVGESPDRATPIPLDQIYRSITREDYGVTHFLGLPAIYGALAMQPEYAKADFSRVVIAAGGHGRGGTRLGDFIVAYALRD